MDLFDEIKPLTEAEIKLQQQETELANKVNSILKDFKKKLDNELTDLYLQTQDYIASGSFIEDYKYNTKNRVIEVIRSFLTTGESKEIREAILETYIVSAEDLRLKIYETYKDEIITQLNEDTKAYYNKLSQLISSCIQYRSIIEEKNATIVKLEEKIKELEKKEV